MGDVRGGMQVYPFRPKQSSFSTEHTHQVRYYRGQVGIINTPKVSPIDTYPPPFPNPVPRYWVTTCVVRCVFPGRAIANGVGSPRVEITMYCVIRTEIRTAGNRLRGIYTTFPQLSFGNNFEFSRMLTFLNGTSIGRKKTVEKTVKKIVKKIVNQSNAQSETAM